jgi:hypothetical protein
VLGDGEVLADAPGETLDAALPWRAVFGAKLGTLSLPQPLSSSEATPSNRQSVAAHIMTRRIDFLPMAERPPGKNFLPLALPGLVSFVSSPSAREVASQAAAE